MIVHFILHGETLESISEEIKLENPKYLKEYHNKRCAREDYIQDELIPRKKLLIPDLKDINEYNSRNDAPFKHPKLNPVLSFDPENFSKIYDVNINEITKNEAGKKGNFISFTVSLKWVRKDSEEHIFHLFKNNFYDQSGSKMSDLATECMRSLNPAVIKTDSKGKVISISLKKETIDNFHSIKEKLLDLFPDKYAKIYIDEYEMAVLDQKLFDQRMRDDTFIKTYFAPVRNEFINGKSYVEQTVGEDNTSITIQQKVGNENYSQEISLVQISPSNPDVDFNGKYTLFSENGLIKNIDIIYSISRYGVQNVTNIKIKQKS
ncbi:hypothetical protein [Chryseobacterium limigenitum]|uniref:LysM domain-containing protein n=1 Tax=Chryseobacterium limigenitum TaxID=1612149 RepID=A0A1K2IPG8_9FLAO|nr:hypothetical protein [Chryseobacterium limigenitum]SFZ94198.1 hypothetical protein SAMN05216324_106141 [Chryseobacterium limigenitum]